jgi:hypothetical protein
MFWFDLGENSRYELPLNLCEKNGHLRIMNHFLCTLWDSPLAKCHLDDQLKEDVTEAGCGTFEGEVEYIFFRGFSYKP